MKIIDFIETMKVSAANGVSPLQLGRNLTGEPHFLTPPEATQIMDHYRKHFSAAFKAETRVQALKALPEERAPRKPSPTNRSAVKGYALKVSKVKRAGHFKRVAESFYEVVEAELVSKLNLATPVDVEPDGDADWLINGRLVKIAEEKLNDLTKRIVYGKVIRHPTVGITLKG